jgi:spectinomycin phosphotransferase
MLEKLSIADQRIISCLKDYYGIEVAKLTFLPLGADNNASVYKAQAKDKRCYFIKLKKGHQHEISVEVLKLLHDSGVQEIIPPLKTVHGKQIQLLESFTLIVYPFIEGKDGFSRELSEKQWIKLGHALKRIHQIAVPTELRNKIRNETYSAKWRQIVRSFYEAEQPTSDDAALKLWKFMQEHRQKIRRLVDRAEELGQKLMHESHPFVLCHSDIHGGNVLLEGEATIYIVDWDDPIMAPKERDLMFIGGGVANVWNKPHEEKLFYNGYGKTEVNPELLSYYRHERIVEDIAVYAQLLLLTTEGGEDRRQMYKHFVDMFEPQGVVDIAFKNKTIL